MQLAKAREVLEQELHLAERQPELDVIDALKLGIEALKRVEEHRKPEGINPHLALPGETRGEHD